MSKRSFQVLAAQPLTQGQEPPTEIELLQVGDWQTPWKGHIVNTVADFNEMVANFNSGKFQPDNKLPINIDHGMQEAAGWIHGLEVRGDSLWGVGVEWTPMGKQKLADKEYAYLSSEWSPVWQNPLNEDEYVDNVFEGAAITNYPLFSTLSPLAASHKQKKELTATGKNIKLYMKGSVMDLADLLAKDSSELSNEEKQFIVEHRSELTDEQVTSLTEAGVLVADSDADAGTDADAADDDTSDSDADADADSDTDSGTDQSQQASKKVTTIEATKLAKLEADAKLGVEASRKLEAMEASNKTQAMLITANNKGGKFLESEHGKLTGFYQSLNANQKLQFEKLVANLPKLPLGASAGHSEQGSANSEAADLIAQAEKLVADKKAPNFQEAMKQVTASNKETLNSMREEQ